jgi:hypothetical protein
MECPGSSKLRFLKITFEENVTTAINCKQGLITHKLTLVITIKSSEDLTFYEINYQLYYDINLLLHSTVNLQMN